MRHRLILLSLLLLAACGGGGGDDDQDSPTKKQARKKPPVRPASGKALVNVDNGSPDGWELSVDGKRWGKLPAHSIVGFQLPAGEHRFEVTHGGQRVARLTATLSRDTLTVLNPRRLGSYELTTVTYVAGPAIMRFGGSGPTTRKLGNPRLLQVRCYYDLLHHMPSMITMKVRLGQVGATEQRSKLYREAPAEPTPAEVLALVAGNPEAYRASARKKAVRRLAELPPDPKTRDLLISCVERGRMVDSAFQVLARRYAEQLEPERIAGWLAGDKTSVGAARLLLARRQGMLLATSFDKVPDLRKQQVLGEARRAPAAVRRRLIETALSLDWKYKRSAVTSLLGSKDLGLDQPLAERIERWIAGMDPKERQRMKSTWSSILCRSARTLPRAWLLPRLSGMLADPRMASQAIGALVELGATDALVGALGKLSESQRSSMYRRLSFAMRKGKPSAADKKLLFAGLADPAHRLRAYVFTLLCSRMSGDPEVDEALSRAVQRETDARTRGEMDRQLTSAARRRLSGATPERLRQSALTGATQGVVAQALDRLYRDHRRRGEHLEALAAGFGKCSASNRAWLLLGLRRFATLPACQALLARGLADADGGVREAAVAGWLATQHQVGPGSEKVLAAIRAEKDPARRAAMNKRYKLWLIGRLKGERRRRDTRARAQAKLLELAGDADAEVSLAALGELSFLRDGDVGLLPALTGLYDRAPSAAHKLRILQDVQFIKGAEVLALFGKALADADAQVRYSAFSLLYYGVRNRRRSKPEVWPLLEAAVGREKEAGTRTRMQRLLSRRR